MLVAAVLTARAFQGMATPSRAPRPAPKIETNLPPIHVDFRDIAVEAGLTAPNVSGSAVKKKYIIETTGMGVAIFDYDNDGLPDIFLVNGTTLEGHEKATSHLYRNLGNLRFEDVTAQAGLTHTGWGQGVCVGDYDNDGLRDMFVTYYGHSILYHNEGHGVFKNVTREAGLESDAVRWDTGCSFVDYDLDGKLDLVVSSYVDFDIAKVPEPGANGFCQYKGLAVACGPRGLPAGRTRLFHNQGGGKFKDVSGESGIAKPGRCYGLTAIASDFDNDGYPDIYVACDSTPSLLFHNLKNGTFEEIGIQSGAALNEDGQEQAGMGVAAVDYDEDGFVDILKTNFADDVPNIYHNNGDGTFTDHVFPSGLGAHTQYLGWGLLAIDADNDGRKDLLVINGHVYPEVDQAKLGTSYKQPRLFYWNVGHGKFQDLSDVAGQGIHEAWSSRGAAAGDLDNDGSLEVVISNMGARPSLLKNYGPAKSWLLTKCTGVKCNRDAIGARVYVFAGGHRISGEIQSGTSFLSQNDARLHFGLGDALSYDRIEVQWPGGQREVFAGGKANRIVELKQGTGSPAR
ncbi:MAG TPA: CRTAC1 family protein [Bryobacteraceae bacterium]|nr:CRTAC1 family protein [Bryobacteraceae bacterium]